MGYTPQQVDEMTLWEFNACVAGYVESKTGDDAPPPTMGDDELADLGIDGF